MTRCLCCTPRPRPRPAPPHAPRRVSEWPAPAVASRSQPVGRPLAARAQIEVRARRGARARDEERGTRHEARGTRQRRDEECRCLPHGAVKEWCCWMRGARACRMGARHVSLRLRLFKESRKQWDCPGHARSASRCGNKPRGFSILLYAYIVTAHFTRLIRLIHKIDRGKMQ